MLTDFQIVRRSLRQRRLSTWVTALSVALAVALMLTLLTLRGAGRRAFERGTGNMHIYVSGDASPLVSVLNGVFYANPPQRALAWSVRQKLADDPRIAWAIPVQQGDSWRGFPAMATTPEFFEKFQPEVDRPFELAEGAFFRAGPEGTYDVVLGARAARESGAKVGDRVQLTHGMVRSAGGSAEEGGAHAGHVHDEAEHQFTVVGILRPTQSAHDRAVFITLEATWLIHAAEKREHEHEGHEHAAGEDHHECDPPTLENLTDDERLITGIYVQVRGRRGSSNAVNVPVIYSELRKDPALTVALPARQIESLFDIVGNVDRIILAIAGVVFVSSGLGILLALYNSMEQRRRQIAVLRVLGATRGRIARLVLGEAVVVGLLGALVGVLIATVGARVAAWALRTSDLGIVIDPVLEPWATGAVVAGAAALALVAGLIPAVAAYRTPVIRNLRPLG